MKKYLFLFMFLTTFAAFAQKEVEIGIWEKLFRST